jgi:hypothetical protein
LRNDVKALDQESKNFLDKMVHTVFRRNYEKHYKKLMELWRDYEVRIMTSLPSGVRMLMYFSFCSGSLKKLPICAMEGRR